MKKISTLLLLVGMSCGMAQADGYMNNIVAYYNFDDATIANYYDSSETGTPSYTTGTESLTDAEAPTLVTDDTRSSQVLHTNFGYTEIGKSYLAMPNPLYGETLTDGFTISFWLNNVSANIYDTMFSFYSDNDGGRLCVGGGGYISYNDWLGHYIDIDWPSDALTVNIPANTWTYVTLTISSTEGAQLYFNGNLVSFQTVSGSVSLTLDTISEFPWSGAVEFIPTLSYLYLGYGGWWGSLDAYYDNVAVFTSALTADEVSELYTAESASTDITGIKSIKSAVATTTNGKVYNLSGQCVGTSLESLPAGIYIQGGKKYVVK